MKKDLLKSRYRTHTCEELRPSNAGERVVLSGWVARKRDHGGIVFVDLRDHYGIVQLVFADSLKAQIQDIRLESVILIEGVVELRPSDLVNPAISTGEVEVKVDKLEVLSESEVLPFPITDSANPSESNRLKFRFLDLRRPKVHKNIATRCEVIKALREIMHSLGFLEIQTPILTSTSPEGARDFIVPSRLHPGKFFALPQAPQQFKQLLMISGFDRYFQIAPCFRDEDPRADRSPGEFYQLDMEFAFVEQRDVLRVNEIIFQELFNKFSNKRVNVPFPQLTYNEAIDSYRSDKPDLR
ncbi:MAG: aspartate--tRNA ligase, partial [Candidatus Dadabacteria bacterium]